MVRQTLDKLGPIKTDIIRTDSNWQQWNFERLLKELREYTIRNPETNEQQSRHQDQPPRYRDNHKNGHGRTYGYQATTIGHRRATCIYCNDESHRSIDCDKVSDIKERKEILNSKKLCYNCTGSNHNISSCRSRSCARCNQRHHTSICHLKEEKTQQEQLSTQKPTAKPASLYMVKENQETIHPTLVAQCQGQKFRILLDTGAGNSFVSSTFISQVNVRPAYWETKSLETMTTTVKQKLLVCNLTIQSIDGTFTVPIKVNKLDCPVLATLSNPRISQLKSKYPHLDGITFDNEDDKLQHPIHVILGAGDFANIKTGGFIAGRAGEPIAEKTLLGWTLMGNGNQSTNVAFLANTSKDDYKKLYSLDVLGLEENREGDNALIHQDFKEQLKRNDDGIYSTRMPWKPNHSLLPNNELQSIARLNKQTSRLKKDPQLMNDYHQILQTQLNEGILEEAPAEPTGERICYLPYRAVIKPNRETTKIRLVYDASAKINQDSPLLNDCLHVGPSLTSLLQDLLIRQRLKPIALLGDIKQAFHQIRVAEEDRDALRLHWYKDIKDFEPTTLRFTKLPMGCGPSPFMHNATLSYHLEQAKENGNFKRDVIEDIQDNLFVDDLTSGGQTETGVLSLKNTAKEVLASAGFTQHKIHSNLLGLEDNKHPSVHEDTVTYAKQHVGTKS